MKKRNRKGGGKTALYFYVYWNLDDFQLSLMTRDKFPIPHPQNFLIGIVFATKPVGLDKRSLGRWLELLADNAGVVRHQSVAQRVILPIDRQPSEKGFTDNDRCSLFPEGLRNPRKKLSGRYNLHPLLALLGNLRQQAFRDILPSG